MTGRTGSMKMNIANKSDQDDPSVKVPCPLEVAMTESGMLAAHANVMTNVGLKRACGTP